MTFFHDKIHSVMDLVSIPRWVGAWYDAKAKNGVEQFEVRRLV
jgi:hypothetical protein